MEDLVHLKANYPDIYHFLRNYNYEDVALE